MTLLDLVGLHEVARMAGVSRQRAFILARRADFPKPAAAVATGRLWRRSDIARWLDRWERAPGRPTKGGKKPR